MLAIVTQVRDGNRYAEAAPMPGARLDTLIEEAIALADKLEVGVTFMFNGHEVWVVPGQDARTKTAWYWRMWFKEHYPWDAKKEEPHPP